MTDKELLDNFGLSGMREQNHHRSSRRHGAIFFSKIVNEHGGLTMSERNPRRIAEA